MFEKFKKNKVGYIVFFVCFLVVFGALQYFFLDNSMGIGGVILAGLITLPFLKIKPKEDH